MSEGVKHDPGKSHRPNPTSETSITVCSLSADAFDRSTHDVQRVVVKWQQQGMVVGE